MERVIKILMKRDGISRDHAKEMVEDTIEELYEIAESGGSIDDTYDLIRENLGLDPDYLEDLIG